MRSSYGFAAMTLGFWLSGRVRMTPGWINFEQVVERWVLERDTATAIGLDGPGGGKPRSEKEHEQVVS